MNKRSASPWSPGRHDAVDRVPVAAGAITAVLGAGVLLAPDQSAALAGLPRSDRVRLIGIGDLALVPGLIGGRRRWPWLFARIAENLALAGYLLSQTGSGNAVRLRGIALGLLAVSAGDLYVIRTLRRRRRG